MNIRFNSYCILFLLLRELELYVERLVTSAEAGVVLAQTECYGTGEILLDNKTCLFVCLLIVK